MINIPNVFQQMKLDKYYKFIALFSGIVLIMSLFADIKIVDGILVFEASLLSFIFSICIWFWEDNIKNKKEKELKGWGILSEENKKSLNKLESLDITIQCVLWILWMIIVIVTYLT